ncbi:MAG: radical SAM protein [Candidatus Cryptobacteroides sp.]
MLETKYRLLNEQEIFAIPVGKYFDKEEDACYLVYSPLANLFYLSLPKDVEELQDALVNGTENALLDKLLNKAGTSPSTVTTTDTFCTLHLLLNEKCNFHCKYCYSAEGRSSQELDIGQVKTILSFFLSADRMAVKDRTVMFMGGGEPVLSWKLLKEATLEAERISNEQNITLHLSLTTNGSIMTDEMLTFLKEHNFTVQISFEILPDVQNEQRGSYEAVAKNLQKLTEYGINNYVRSTITEENVDRIPEMVEHCHKQFPKVAKMSCQQVVDPSFFTSKAVVDNFFNRYFESFQAGVKKAEKYGITLRSSSSHLLNYSKREKFCYNLLCLTPSGTLTMCPDVSSPKEKDYKDSLIGEIQDSRVIFDKQAFERLSHGSIHTIDKCRNCYARWNCGSGCPSSRRVYTAEIFDAICDYYRKMLTNSLMEQLALKYEKTTKGNFYLDMAAKL